MRALLLCVMRAPLLCVVLTVLPAVASAAEPPFDLRALRSDWPGHGRVILDKEVRITTLEDRAGLRLAIRTSTAVLTEADRDDLNLFSEEDRPGCREPGGIRIEVLAPDGTSALATKDDMVRMARGEGAIWKGPRPGVRAGALIQESFHIDYSAHCFDGVVSVARDLGDDEAPVLSEALIVDCGDCAAVVTGGLELTAEEDRRVLRRARVLPPPPEPHVPDSEAARFYVSTSDDPLALGRRVVEALSVEQRRWTGVSGSWAREARANSPHLKDKPAQLATYLAGVPVWQRGTVWKRGLSWGDPASPGVRWLEPTEWLALSTVLLKRYGGVPLLLADLHGPRPQGVGSVFDWDEYGVLIPGRGVVTTTGWRPFSPGLETSGVLSGRAAVLLEEGGPRMTVFPVDAAARRRSWDTTIEASGSSSLLVRVEHRLADGWGARQALYWRSMEDSAKKRKASPEEAARDFGARFFDKRRLAATTISVSDEALRVEAAWTLRGAQRRHEGGMSVPVPVPGLSPWVQVVDAERTQGIDLGASHRSGSVRVRPIEGYAVAGLPADEHVGDGPIRLRAAWSTDGGDALLTWSLVIDDDVLPPETAGDVAAVGAALRRLSSLSLVLVKE